MHEKNVNKNAKGEDLECYMLYPDNAVVWCKSSKMSVRKETGCFILKIESKLMLKKSLCFHFQFKFIYNFFSVKNYLVRNRRMNFAAGYPCLSI